jgi:hypothetical protein
MTREFQNRALALSVLGLGLAAWAVAGRSLKQDGEFNYAPNVLHLKGSPFGRTIAMAMQGPADVYFHEGQAHNHEPGESDEGCGECDSLKAKQAALESVIVASTESDAAAGDDLLVSIEAPERVHSADCGHSAGPATHKHGPGEECAGCDDEATVTVANAEPARKGLRETMLDQIREWRAADNSRTNPFGTSEAHKFFIRREIEKKLFLSYQMDPTNYAGYGAYFLFLNESALGTREDGKKHARRLAEVTAARCVQEQDNPQALLTAAVASHDVISILIEEDFSEVRGLATQYAAVTEHCLNQFEEVALEMVFNGTWERFSVARQNEMSERAHLLRKLHEADRKIMSASVNNAAHEGANREDSPTG